MKRIQRKRTKGWKMPENCIYVGRPTKWGNPVKLVGDIIYIHAGYRRKGLDPWVFYNVGDKFDIIHLYSLILLGLPFVDKDLQYWSDKFKENDLNELKNKNLACFCPIGEPCHADILIHALNETFDVQC